MSRDPVFYQDGTVVDEDGEVRLPGWYFSDETWAYAYGPYQTQEEANKKLGEYVKQL
jgi:hypothetical protein